MSALSSALKVLFSREKMKAFKDQKRNPNYLSFIGYTYPKTKKKSVKAKSKKTDQLVDDRKRKATARARRAIKGF